MGNVKAIAQKSKDFLTFIQSNHTNDAWQTHEFQLVGTTLCCMKCRMICGLADKAWNLSYKPRSNIYHTCRVAKCDENGMANRFFKNHGYSDKEWGKMMDPTIAPIELGSQRVCR